MKAQWLRWAGLALVVSPWGCGGSAHEQSDPSHPGGAPDQGGAGGGLIGAGYPGAVSNEAGSPGTSYGGLPINSGGSSGAQTAGSSKRGRTARGQL